MNENISTDGSPKKNNIVKYAPIVFSVVVFVVLFTAIFLNMKPARTALETKLDPQEELMLQEQIAPLIKAGDMKACDQVQNDMYKKVCINNIALQKAEETKDISFCQYLDNELISRESCERQVISQKSIEREDRSICRETQNETLQKECEGSYFFGLAQKKQDPKLCDQDTDTTQANQCWNVYHTQSMMNPTSDGKPQPLNCALLRGDDAKADCATIAPAIKRGDTQKLAEACQAKKSDVFNMVCMMALQQGGVPGVDRVTQAP
ncbi:MAG TPA: hypothetical protein DCS20_04560 [Candidatus Yonathbacteria bacterium]|nr:hypothetical protein [Candidatus Yonathbacteria bacterium]